MLTFVKKTFLFATILSLTVGESVAKDTCQCPVLSVQDVKELYESGQTYDNYRGYIPYTKRKVTEKARNSIASVVPQSATRSADGSCVCQYLVRDQHGNEVDQLGLEKL